MLVAALVVLSLARQASSGPPEIQTRRLTLVAQSSTNRLEDIAINADETRILTHDRNYAPRLWDRKTMRLLKVLNGHSTPVFTSEFSLDGRRVLTLDSIMAITWDSRNGEQSGLIALPDDEFFSDGAFSGDSALVVLGSGQGRILVCNDKLEAKWDLKPFQGRVTDVQCAANAQVACAADENGRVVAVSLATGKVVATFEAGKQVLWSRIDKSGKHILATTIDEKAHLYDVAAKRELHTYGHYMGTKGDLPLTLMASLFVGKDSELVLVAEESGTMRLYDVKTGQVAGRLEGHTATVREIRQSLDGTKVATYGDDEQLKIWDTIAQRELPFTRGPGNPTAGEFSPDGSAFWLGMSDGSLRRHDTKTGNYDSETVGQTSETFAAARSGRWLYFQGEEDWLIDVLNPTTIHKLGWYIQDFTFSPSGEKASWKTPGDDEYYICDVASGTPLMRYLNCRGAKFTRDSKFLVTWHGNGGIDVWRTSDGELEKGWEISKDEPRKHLAVSPTEDLVATIGEEDGYLQVWNYLDGNVRFTSEVPFEGPVATSFSNDGQVVAVASYEGIALWDVKDGKYLGGVEVPLGSECDDLQFSPDDSMIAFSCPERLVVADVKSQKVVLDHGADVGFTGTGVEWSKSNAIGFMVGNLVMVIDPKNPEAMRLVRTTETARSFEFSSDGKRVTTADSCDGLVVWDLPDKNGVATRVGSFVQMKAEKGNTWLATDVEGRYDASDPANVSGAHYVLEWSGGLETIAVEQLKDQFFEPGLLAKILGLDQERPRTVPGLDSLKLYPDVKLELSGGSLSVTIEERDDGGVGVMRLWVNGKQVMTRNRPPGYFTIETAALERYFLPSNLLPEGHGNLVRVTVTNKAGDLESPGATVDVGVPADLTPPDIKLFALCVGISDYAGQAKDLTAPANDARALEMALKTVADKLLPGHVEATLLTSEPGKEATSRAEILKWFDDVATKSTSSDIVVVFLSGHGVNQIAGDQDYFFLTPEADPSSVGPLTATTAAISGKLLGEKLSKIAASKQVVILDTCHSGAFSSELVRDKSVSGDYRRAWQAIRDTTGTWMLAGSAADQQSFEATSVGHGMLTYALLEAMDRASAQGLRQTEGGDLFVDVERWLEYAEARVESLKNEVGIAGVQRPQLARSAGASFDIGVMQTSQRGFIGLKPPRPIVIVGQFDQDREDPAHMEQAVTDALKADESLAVWTDVLSHPRAFFLTGSYTLSPTGIKATVYLQRFGDGRERKTIEKFDVEGKTVQEVVSLMAAKATDLIKKAKPVEPGEIKTGGG